MGQHRQFFMMVTRWSKQIGYRINKLISVYSFLYRCNIHRYCTFKTPLQCSTVTVKAVFVDHCNDVQWREIGQLGTTLKQSRINGVERKELRYHAHECPEAVRRGQLGKKLALYVPLPPLESPFWAWWFPRGHFLPRHVFT